MTNRRTQAQPGDTLNETAAAYVEVAPLPTVVQPEQVHELRTTALQGETPAAELTRTLHDLVAGYCIADDRAAADLQRLLEGLCQRKRGIAMLVNGVYGAGKTHLLALLGLLCESQAAVSLFRDSHPEQRLPRDLARPDGPVTVYVSLESYSGRRRDLEDVLWQETAHQLGQRGIHWDPAAGEGMGSREAVLRALLERLADNGRSGCIWLVDELSTFLGAKSAAQLQNEAAFLQFLAHRTARHPVSLVASVQRSLEHLGDLDTYSLRQLKDRFLPPVTLSLTHIRRLLRERIIRQRDPEACLRCLHAQCDALHAAFPRWEWGVDQLTVVYPFHPATIDCLEQVTGRFFSRTRSALGFLQAEARRFLAEADKGDAVALITPDRIFDHFQTDLEANPDLRAYVTEVWRHYEQNLPQIVDHDQTFAARIVKLLTVLKIGARYPTVVEVTNDLLFATGLPGQGSYGYTQAVLEALRTRGDFVTVRRHPEPFADQYTIDLGARLGAALRRRLVNTTHLFSATDSRLARTAFAACDGNDWPLARTVEGARFTASWRYDRRSLFCRLTAVGHLTPASLANEAGRLRHPGTEEDMLLLLADPVNSDQVRETFEAAVEALPADRWRAAVVLWVPREPEPYEREKLKEYAAARLLEQDPALRDNPRGRKLLELLRQELPGLAAECRCLIRALYGAGALVTAAGQEDPLARDPTELPDWSTALTRILARQLPQVFPRCPERPMSLAAGLATAAADLTAHRLKGDGSLPSRAEDLAAFLESLEPELREAVLEQVPTGDFLSTPTSDHLIAYDRLLALLRKSDRGLPEALVEPVVAGLLAAGELQGLDGDMNPLAPAALSPPLGDALSGLCRGRLLSSEQWQTLVGRCAPILGAAPDTPSFAAQQAVWDSLVRWKTDFLPATERALARLAQIRRSLGHSAADWRDTTDAAAEVGVVLGAIDPLLPASQGLTRLLEVTSSQPRLADADALATVLGRWKQAVAFLNDVGNEVLLAHAYLCDSGLSTPPGPLTDDRQALLKSLQSGEALIADAAEFLARWTAWRDAYTTAYEQWHHRVYRAERFRPYSRLRQSPALRALQQLDRLGVPVPCSVSDLLEQVGKEFGKCCDQPGLAASLRAFPQCTRCRLRLGEEVKLTPVEELRDRCHDAFRQNFRTVFAEPRRSHWLAAAQTEATPAHRRLLTLCRLDPDSASPETAAGALTEDVVELLLSLPAARPPRRRRFRDLRALLSGKTLTLGEARRTLDQWLNPTGSLTDNDPVHFED